MSSSEDSFDRNYDEDFEASNASPIKPGGPPSPGAPSLTGTHRTNQTTTTVRSKRPATLEDMIAGKCHRLTSPRSLRAVQSCGYDEKVLIQKHLREMLPAAKFDPYVAQKNFDHIEGKRQAIIQEVREAYQRLLHDEGDLTIASQSDEADNARKSCRSISPSGSLLVSPSFNNTVEAKKADVSARVKALRKRQNKALDISRKRQAQALLHEEQCQEALKEHKRKVEEAAEKESERAYILQEESRRRDRELEKEAKAREEERLKRVKEMEEQKLKVLAAQAETERHFEEQDKKRQLERDIRNAEKRRIMQKKRDTILTTNEQLLKRRIEESESRHEKTQQLLQMHAEKREEESKIRAQHAEEAHRMALIRKQKALDSEREKVLATVAMLDQVEERQQRLQKEADEKRKAIIEAEKEKEKQRVAVRVKVEKERVEKSHDLEERIRHHETVIETQKAERRQLAKELKIVRDLNLSDKVEQVARTKKLNEFALGQAKERLESKLKRVEEMKAQEEVLKKQSQIFRKQLDAMKNTRAAASPGPGEYLGTVAPAICYRREPSHKIALRKNNNENGLSTPGPGGYNPKFTAIMSRKPGIRLPSRDADLMHQQQRLKDHQQGEGFFLSESKGQHGAGSMIGVPVSAEVVRPSSVPSEVSSQDFEETRRSQTSFGMGPAPLPPTRGNAQGGQPPAPSSQGGPGSPHSESDDVYKDDFSDDFPDP